MANKHVWSLDNANAKTEKNDKRTCVNLKQQKRQKQKEKENRKREKNATVEKLCFGKKQVSLECENEKKKNQSFLLGHQTHIRGVVAISTNLTFNADIKAKPNNWT